MANSTFSGPLRSESTVKTVSKNATTGTITEITTLGDGPVSLADITGGALNTEITQLDRYVRQNDLLKEIRVFKKEVVGQVSDAIKTAIRS